MPAPHDTFTILGTPSEWARAAAWADERDEVPDVHGSIEEIPVPFCDVVFPGGHTHLPGYLADAHTRRAPLRGLPRPVPPEVLRQEYLDHLALKGWRLDPDEHRKKVRASVRLTSKLKSSHRITAEWTNHPVANTGFADQVALLCASETARRQARR